MKKENKQAWFQILTGIGLLGLASKSQSKASPYFRQVLNELNKADDMYTEEGDVDEIVKQFGFAQEQVHSPEFKKLSKQEQSALESRFTRLGNRMMKGS